MRLFYECLRLLIGVHGMLFLFHEWENFGLDFLACDKF